MSFPTADAQSSERISPLLSQFNSEVFVEFLEALTGIQGLIPDPYFEGGGLQSQCRCHAYYTARSA